MINPFITSLAMGVMIVVSAVTLFFAAVLALDWVIRKIYGVKKR